MNSTHLFILFGASAILIILKVIIDWKKIDVTNKKNLDNYVINILIFKSFTNTGLVLYGVILALFLISQISDINLFSFFADNIGELSLYIGAFSFYMIIKGIFGILEMIKCKDIGFGVVNG